MIKLSRASLFLISLLSIAEAGAATQVAVGQVSSSQILMAAYGLGEVITDVRTGTAGGNQAKPVRTSGLEDGVQSISGGRGYGRAVKDGAVYWWGFSQCSSNNPSDDSWIPTPIMGLQSNVTMVSGDSRRACVIKDGGVWCWGSACAVTQHWNEHVCPADVCRRPIPLPALQQGVTSISVGSSIACAIKDGGLWRWNYNPNIEAALVPELAEGVTSVDVSDRHGCAVRDGEVWCWGDNSGNKLGYPTETNWSPNPHKVVGLEPRATLVAAGAGQSCAIVENGDVWCWGYVNGVKSGPIRIDGLPRPATQISLTSHQYLSMPNSCVVLDQGEIWCWGALISDPGAQTSIYSQPTKVEGLPAEVQTVPVAIATTPIPKEFRADGLARMQELEATVMAQNTEITDLRAMVRMLLGKLELPIPPEFEAPGAQ